VRIASDRGLLQGGGGGGGRGGGGGGGGWGGIKNNLKRVFRQRSTLQTRPRVLRKMSAKVKKGAINNRPSYEGKSASLGLQFKNPQNESRTQ